MKGLGLQIKDARNGANENICDNAGGAKKDLLVQNGDNVTQRPQTAENYSAFTGAKTMREHATGQEYQSLSTVFLK